MSCSCDPKEVDGWQYVQWIGTYFNDCVYTPLDIVAFLSGMLSMLIFLCSMMPQWYKNYQRKKVDGLSLLFLLTWLFGDISNTLGAFLTNQFPTVRYSGMYFLCCDVINLTQYAYYSHFYKRPRSKTSEVDVESDRDRDSTSSGGREFSDKESVESISLLNEGQSSVDRLLSLEDDGDFILHRNLVSSNSMRPTFMSEETVSTEAPYRTSGGGVPSHSIYVVAAVCVLITGVSASFGVVEEVVKICNAHPELSEATLYLGSVLGWISGSLYFFSRIPQIITNYHLKEVEGLSILLFLMSIAGNLTYGFGIMLRFPKIDADFYKSTLPYLIGSVGTFIFDFTIVFQAILYSKPSSSGVLGRWKREMFGYQPISASD